MEEENLNSGLPWYNKYLIICPVSRFYKIWQFIVMLTCGVTAILYPFCILNQYYSFLDRNFLILMSGEAIMLFDIVINMLLAYKSDDDLHYITDISKTSRRYIYEGSFVKELIIWIPFSPLTIYFPALKYIQIIKSIRFQ